MLSKNHKKMKEIKMYNKQKSDDVVTSPLFYDFITNQALRLFM